MPRAILLAFAQLDDPAFRAPILWAAMSSVKCPISPFQIGSRASFVSNTAIRNPQRWLTMKVWSSTHPTPVSVEYLPPLLPI